MRLLLGKDLAHAAAALGRTEPLGSGTGTPAERLSVQISEIAETTRGEERFANETDRALHPTFLVPPRYRDRPRLEAVVGSQLEQRGMEADRLTHALLRLSYRTTRGTELYQANASTWPRMK